ncbi:hypothetical protein C4573_03575 [Candidatus Woesearchaeota archaeon]|nr:MAG: hypothetical protein C4573_03575 [Candidatus Woesearchaeota archaeon]
MVILMRIIVDEMDHEQMAAMQDYIKRDLKRPSFKHSQFTAYISAIAGVEARKYDARRDEGSKDAAQIYKGVEITVVEEEIADTSGNLDKLLEILWKKK